LRIVCISDTHSRHKKIKDVPQGDVLVCAGDFTSFGTSKSEIRDFVNWLNGQDHKYKIFIAGNHDRLFEEDPKLALQQIPDYCDVIYLQDKAITLDGVKFYGSPWQPEFYNWAFNLPRGKALRDKWSKIPKDTNVLITHGPPHGILDEVPDRVNPHKIVNCGCEELVKAVKLLPELKCHIFGHIHEGYGTYADNGVKFINASICTRSYEPTNKPIVFDLS